MDYQNHKLLRVIIIGVGILLLVLKLSTGIVTYMDEPTTFFVIKKVPSFINEYYLSNTESLNDFIVLLFDENGLIGESVYHFFVEYLVWGYLGLVVLFHIYKKKMPPK